MPGGVLVEGGGTVGDHFDLMRLYQRDGTATVQKGRQRVRPRKKKFSSLKKKVLEERLRKWKELHPDGDKTGNKKSGNEELPPSGTVRLHGYCEHEELEDDDEYEEILENLREMAAKVGTVKRLFIPRDIIEQVPVFVEFEDPSNAAAAVECWNALMLGGNTLGCQSFPAGTSDRLLKSEEGWHDWCIESEHHAQTETKDVIMEDNTAIVTELILENAITEDDLEDEESLEESLNDIRALACKYGAVESVHVAREGLQIRISYKGDAAVARQAAVELNKVVVGGSQLSAKLVEEEETTENDGPGVYLILDNVLTKDDLEDEDCLEESMNDVRELAQQYGEVCSVLRHVCVDPEIGERALRIYFASVQEAEKAFEGFNGLVIGGLAVSASLPEEFNRSKGVPTSEEGLAANDKEPEVMYSGDKIISERFAACKRVPKVSSSSSGPRKYATLAEDETVKTLLVEMLGELMRLQRRAAEEKNAKAKRRIVMGLREVARGIRSHKVRMVVMANNLDEYGVIDEKLQEIIDLAHAEDIPVFYEFSKRTLGKALGKTIKVAVAGVQNTDGAHQQFKKLVKLSQKMP
jgi:ribosomal protein L7Ae-like RNA K-turn-binding protein